MSKLKLVIAPDPILKKISQPVSNVDNSIRKLMDDMLVTMYEEQGIGLAAVQVGVLKRVIIVDIGNDDLNDKKPIFLANPEIEILNDKTSTFNEGCLSFPEQRIEIQRPEKIKVKYIDYNDNYQELIAEGLMATAIQHEVDHINGIVISDHASKLKHDMMLKKAQKIKKMKSNYYS